MKFFSKSIKYKILLGFFIVLFPAFLINGYFWIQSNSNLSNARYLKENSLPNYVLLGQLKRSVNEITNWLTHVSATRSQKGYEEGYVNAEGQLQVAKSILVQLINNYNDEKKDTTLLQSIQKEIDNFHEVGKEMAYAYRDGGTDAGNEMMTVFFTVSEEFRGKIRGLEKEIESSHEETVSSMEKKLNTTEWIIMIFSTLFAILATVVSVLIASLLVKPIRSLNRVIKEIRTQKDLSLKAEVHGIDEMAMLAKEFNHMTDKLLENEREIKAARDALWGEMQLAKKIQTSLVPREPKIQNCEVLGYMETASEVGGDYYDTISFHSGEKDWIVIGDVSGHGVPAGLVMMMVQSLMHAIIQTGHYETPAEILSEINKTLTKNIKKLSENKYMTITLLSLDRDGNLEYAGVHQDLLVYRNKKKEVEQIETTGFWIGIEEDISLFLDNKKSKLDKGDLLLLYTDGITESVNSKNEMYSVQGLKNVLQNGGIQDLEKIKNSLLDSLSGYKNDDDITFLMVRKS